MAQEMGQERLTIRQRIKQAGKDLGNLRLMKPSPQEADLALAEEVLAADKIHKSAQRRKWGPRLSMLATAGTLADSLWVHIGNVDPRWALLPLGVAGATYLYRRSGVHKARAAEDEVLRVAETDYADHGEKHTPLSQRIFAAHTTDRLKRDAGIAGGAVTLWAIPAAPHAALVAPFAAIPYFALRHHEKHIRKGASRLARSVVKRFGQ